MSELIRRTYHWKLWIFLILLAFTNIGGSEGGWETGGEKPSCEDCEAELRSGITLSPSSIEIFEAGPTVQSTASIRTEEGAQWDYAWEREDFSSGLHAIDSMEMAPQSGTETTISITPAEEVFTWEVTGRREPWYIKPKRLKIIGQPLGENPFPINHRWLTVKVRNPAATVVSGVPAQYVGNRGHYLVASPGSTRRFTLEAVNSTPEVVWTGWQVHLPYGSFGGGIQANIEGSTATTAKLEVVIAPDVPIAAEKLLRVTAQRAFGAREWNGIKTSLFLYIVAS